jgi:GT2 family glycosyltransferase
VPPVGPVGDFGFGGDVMIRSDSFERVGGYADDLIAGEDPELSARLCAAGGEVVRLDEDMTRHDADMHRFGQWWTRNKRSGHAYAEVAARHRDTGLFAAHLRSGWVWGFAVPAVMVGGLALGAWPILMLLGLYPLRALRIARWLDPARFGNGDRLVWGLSCIASQFPGWLGAATFAFNRARGRRASLMEYKGPEDVEGGR